MSSNKDKVDIVQQAESGGQVDSTRDRLLQVAEELFAENGFDGTSLRKIASVVGIRTSSIAYYFPTKRKLYKAVLGRIADSMREGIIINSNESDPVRDIHNMIEQAVIWTQKNPGRERILMRELMENVNRLDQAKDLILADIFKSMRSPIDKLKNQDRLAAFDADILLFSMIGAMSYFAVALPTIGQIIGNNDMELLQESVRETTIKILDVCINS
jgi:AcrR family transcriptional regulator